ncbi:IclR family transcriptional regulator [Aneurinibacillus sp. Ricciae_BoGa-3]|uniref:IclR family transcriptional regulator n=1 Tax=Aneurinibacillus sp. Ricciae_BoGa-3 TaxID=3022697 RepID=UPI002340C629|nr:IclR family transcriptional regulator [Aneurinibacillus sp. Ricciae_BoGa-3]WCK56367.1 IclR family transcriptional regulator [Aneurinibacillus sp. Ricciae_BoGa-3]
MSVENSMQTINRAVQILKCFSKDEKVLSLADIHHRLGLSKSSLQRILNTLVINGFIEKDNTEKVYKLGIELYYLGKLVEEHSHLLTIAKPYLKKLRDRFGESVYLNIIENNQRKCIALEEATHDLMTISYIGQTSPLYAGASAKLLLAFLPYYEITDYIGKVELTPITQSTITNKESLKEELMEIKQKGYAISYGERVFGVCSVSAPILYRGTDLIGGLSISAPMVRVSDTLFNEYVDGIKEAANEISNEFEFSVC